MKKLNVSFRAGCESFVDDARQGQSSTVFTVHLILRVDDLVRSDCHVTLRMLVEKRDVNVGIVWTFFYEILLYRKLCAHWVLKRLNNQQKEMSMGTALQCLFRYHENLTFFKRHQARCCSPSFSTSKVHYCLIPRAHRNH